MQGLMQRQPLLVSDLIRHATRHHSAGEIVSRLPEKSLHRTTYCEIERRARRLARVLQRLDVGFGDRVGTLAWNGFRHLELYYGVSGSGAVCHTINPRLAVDDVAYIVDHGGDCVLFADTSFVGLVEAIAPHLPGVRAVVMMCEPHEMPPVSLPRGVSLLCYETLMAAVDEDYVWPRFDENTGSALCYTSGTTGRPKGVLYSHRSTILHALGANQPDAFGICALDRVMSCASMYHGAAWALPYIATMAGAPQILPGRFMDGASLHELLEAERVTVANGVPTIWLMLLQYLKETNNRLSTLRRVISGGSAVPRKMMEGLAELGVSVVHVWGMTETSPVVTCNALTQQTVGLAGEALATQKLRQGRCVFGADFKIVDAEDRELP